MPVLYVFGMKAQPAEQLITGLQTIHKWLKDQSCSANQVVLSRAMNLILADKMGSYLADITELSFYKNYITFNSGTSNFSLNHNFFQPGGSDEPVRTVPDHLLSLVAVSMDISEKTALAAHIEFRSAVFGEKLIFIRAYKDRMTLQYASPASAKQH